VSERPSDWIAAAGLRVVEADASNVGVPPEILADQQLSLIARGLYALLLAQQGQPVDPCEEAFESEEDLAGAIDELLAAGLAVRVAS
jgi:hypothetical protein